MYSSTLLNLLSIFSFIKFVRRFCVSHRSYNVGIETVYTSFQFYVFVSRSHLIALSRAIITVPNRRRTDILAPNFRRKVFSILSLCILLGIDFLRCPLSGWGSSLLFLVYHERVWISYNAFPASIEMIVWVFSFIFLLHCEYNLLIFKVKFIMFSWNKHYLVMMYYSFCIFLDSVC